jgi:hypothetical protein
VPYVRTVKTASGAIAVQIVYSSRRGSWEIEHIGSAHDDVELELLKAVARQRLAAGQGELGPGPGFGGAGRAAADHRVADGLPALCPEIHDRRPVPLCDQPTSVAS